MATLEEFKAMRDAVPMSVQGELFKLMTSDPDASIQRMVEIAAEKGMTVTSEEVRGFLRQMDDDDEFDDFELDAVALAAIAGGHSGLGGECCPMTTLNDFKALRDSVPAEVQGELYVLFTADPEASYKRMVEIAAEKGMTLTVEEVKGFLKQMDEDDEFDDFELDIVALAAIAGGANVYGKGKC